MVQSEFALDGRRGRTSTRGRPADGTHLSSHPSQKTGELLCASSGESHDSQVINSELSGNCYVKSSPLKTLREESVPGSSPSCRTVPLAL